MSVDYFFNYMHVVRFLLVHKVNFFGNSLELPFLKKSSFFFSVVDLSEGDDARIFNYFYLLKFFFGVPAFFANFRKRFSLGRTFYSFYIVSFFTRHLAYFPLFFLVNDMLAMTNKSNYSYFVREHCFHVSFYDMNLFLEKKNNVGLFSLKDYLSSRFVFSAKNFKFYGLLLEVLKVI